MLQLVTRKTKLPFCCNLYLPRAFPCCHTIARLQRTPQWQKGYEPGFSLGPQKSSMQSAIGHISTLPPQGRRLPNNEIPNHDDRIAAGHYAVGVGPDGLPYVVNRRTGRVLEESVNVTVTVGLQGKNGKTVSMPLHMAVARAYDPASGRAHIPRPAGADEDIVDHLDGNRFNNRPSNLRWRSKRANAFNRAGAGRPVPVYATHDPKKIIGWRAKPGTSYETGMFKTPTEAAVAIHAAHVREVGPRFARPLASASRETFATTLRAQAAAVARWRANTQAGTISVA